MGLQRQVGQVGRMGQAGQIRWKHWLPLLILLIAVFDSSIIYAGDGENVKIVVGRSTVLDTGSPIARVSLTSADIADAMVTSTNELLINGKAPGTISMFVWDRAGAIRRYEVIVQRDLARLGEQLKELFPGESIAAQSNGKSIVLSGTVTGKEVIERAVNVAAGYVEKKEDVVPLLQIQSNASNQVLLRVRFAEVSRSAMTELGSSFALNGFKDGRWFARSATEQFPAPEWDHEGKFVFSDFLNLFLYDSKKGIAGVVKALSEKGLFQSLAEPNLVAESGKEASFLAGGEIPIPIAQPGGGGTVAVTVQFKEFGIRLNFTPVVNGNRVHLKVRPEVSTLDFSNAVTLGGFRIPALSTRRTETEIELENGQTFAIAGLMNNTMNSSLQKIPGIGDIPILGLLFKSKAAQKNQTELVVMITPEILPNGSNGVTPNLPKMAEPFMAPIPAKKTIDMPPPPYRGGRSDEHDAAAAAAKMSALTPSAPAVAAAPAAPATPIAAPVVPTAEPKPLPAPKAVSAPAPAAKNPQTESAARAELKAMTEENKRQARAAEEEQRKAAAQKKIDDKAAAEKAKRDEAAAKRQAEIEKAANEAAAKRAAEQAKKQAEIDKRQQKSIEEAQARLKAAEAALQAEVAKKSTKQ
jgi:pilus assembly protein CpaC